MVIQTDRRIVDTNSWFSFILIFEALLKRPYRKWTRTWVHPSMWQFVVWFGHLHIDSLNIIIQHAHFAYIKRTRPEHDALLWELAIICFLNTVFYLYRIIFVPIKLSLAVWFAYHIFPGEYYPLNFTFLSETIRKTIR